jgi:hypothetical protein
MSDQLVAETATYPTPNKNKRQTFTPLAGLEHVIPVTEQAQTCLRPHGHRNRHSRIYRDVVLACRAM